MTTYTFNVLPDTSGNQYRDIQYFNSNFYCVSKASPYILHLSTSGFITPVSADSLLHNINCLAVYDSTTIYCGDSSNIYKVINGVAAQITTISGQLILSMTLNADKTILYIATPAKIHTMSTVTPTTPPALTPTFSNLACIRFVTDTLYVSDYNNTLYTLDSGGTIIRMITTTINPSGCAIDNYGDWYVSNDLSNSGFSLVNNDDTLTDISSNIPLNISFNNIAFDDDDNAYYLSWNTNGIYKSTSAFCFNEGTKILCMNNELKDEYIAIELLKIGDFVKTYKHGYRRVSKVITGSFRNNPKKWNMCMYKMAKTPLNGLIEDLIVTGGHSIMVDKISKTELARYSAFGIPDVAKQTIDKKHIVPACVSDQFTPMQDTKQYNYYHLLLENNDDEEERFGIWANGILTETPNEKTVK
jgi:hypothetical protein